MTRAPEPVMYFSRATSSRAFVHAKDDESTRKVSKNVLTKNDFSEEARAEWESDHMDDLKALVVILKKIQAEILKEHDEQNLNEFMIHVRILSSSPLSHPLQVAAHPRP